jgi:5-methyltetrahydropteroyltriglutamate--homocysteine methyltransferase
MERVLTTHTGSLIRPPELLDLARTIEDGAAKDEAAYDQALEHAVTDVVRPRPGSTSSTTARWARQAGSRICTSG